MRRFEDAAIIVFILAMIIAVHRDVEDLAVGNDAAPVAGHGYRNSVAKGAAFVQTSARK